MKLRKEDYLAPLEECSKEKNGENDVSEYEFMLAVSRMPDEFTSDELEKEVAQVQLNLQLGRLVDLGLVKAVWDEEQQAVTYWSV